MEDDAIVRAWVRLALEGSEFTVAGEAPTIAAARELIARRRVDLMLVDQRLPGKFGTELVRDLRRDPTVQAPGLACRDLKRNP